jgi:hypothetical protein
VPTLALALDEYLAAGGTAATPGGKVDPPANPKESSEVVTAKLVVGEPKDGKRKVTVTLTVAKDWHVYANPVGSDQFAENRTELAVFVGGTEAKADVAYPKGKQVEDPVVGKYAIYEGTVELTATVPADKDATVECRVKVNACSEKTKVCLKPSTLRLK